MTTPQATWIGCIGYFQRFFCLFVLNLVCRMDKCTLLESSREVTLEQASEGAVRALPQDWVWKTEGAREGKPRLSPWS